MLKFAIYSGLCASLGSYFGKLPSIIEENTGATGWILLALQAISFGLMLGVNALVWTFFVKSLQQASTVTATITSSGVNYVVSALLGWIFFKEVNPVSYWFGISLVIIGLAIVNQDKEIKVKDE